MLKLNWWEITGLELYDGNGMPIELSDLPIKTRRQIANAIINGHVCGSFKEFIDEEALQDLNPNFVSKLVSICQAHKDEVNRREIEYAERAKQLAALEAAKEEVSNDEAIST